MTIYEELYKAACTKGLLPRRQNQSDEGYLKLLLEKISGVDDNVWDSLTPEAAEWYNEAVAAVNQLKPIPACPGYKTVIVADDKPKSVETISEKKSVAIKEKDATIKKKNSKPSTGVIDAIRKVVVLNPEWNTRQVYLYLRDNGWPNVNINTIAVDGGNIRRTIDLAKELDLWKTDDKKEEKAN